MTAEISEVEFVEIRTFESFEEIRLLRGFKENNGINKGNYKRLIGDYWFPDEVKCCFLKDNGKLCGEDHKFGFVTELTDGSVTIVGNKCAQDKFGADAKIKADSSKYLKEKRRREKLASIKELLAAKEDRLRELGLFKVRLGKVEERVQAFVRSLGDRTARRLKDMARSANARVVVEAINYKEYIDEEGKKRKERRTSPTTLGALNGLSVLSEHAFGAIYSSIRAIEVAYGKAEAIAESATTSAVESVAAALGDFNRVANEVESLEKDEAIFFANNFSLLCFLVDDKTERYKSSRIALERAGMPGGKDRAKTWLAEQEQEIRKALNADKIGIPF